MNLDPTVQVALVGGLFSIVGLVIGRRQDKHLKELKEHSTQVREQVQNSHTTNLRDDIDRISSLVERVLEGQALDRRALLQLEDRLDHHIDSPHAA